MAKSSVKNNIKDGVLKFCKNHFSETAAEGESLIYLCNRNILHINCVLCKKEFAGISVSYGARIVLYPSFGTTVADIRSKVNGELNVSQKSTLVLEGGSIEIVNGLTLDGTLVVRALNGSSVVLDGLVVKNDGWQFEDIDVDDESVLEKYRIRGYRLNKCESDDDTRNARVICFDDGEKHVLTE